jgi:signal transduction histidine kinase
VQYDIRDVALDEVINTCEMLVAPQARAKRVALSMGVCDCRFRARGDAEKVQQIVVSLLAHGVDLTEPDGRVEASCGMGRSANEVEVRVTDTGPGIQASQLVRVFQPFSHLEAGLTRAREGAGLGLAISRDLARGMGGDLTVDSVLGSGSTFTLTLPASFEPAAH